MTQDLSGHNSAFVDMQDVVIGGAIAGLLGYCLVRLEWNNYEIHDTASIFVVNEIEQCVNFFSQVVDCVFKSN